MLSSYRRPCVHVLRSRGAVVEVVDGKSGWRSFSSMKRQSLEADMKTKVRTITVNAGHRLVLTCPTYDSPLCSSITSRPVANS